MQSNTIKTRDVDEMSFALFHPPSLLEEDIDIEYACFEGHKIRYTQKKNLYTGMEDISRMDSTKRCPNLPSSQPVQVSVFDLLSMVTGESNPSSFWRTLQLLDKQIVQGITNFEFKGSGEGPTPVCSVQKMIELINILPGIRAARFKASSAKALVRLLGGDEALFDEITNSYRYIPDLH